MKIINLEQNSPDWKEWRNRGLGASCAPIVMGTSPWTSPFQLWLELTGLCEKAPANEFAIAAMKRGHELEPAAREKAEKQLGRAYPALCAEHDEFGFIRASFDGYDAATNTIIEIKCPGKADHAKALAGKIPDKYYPQLQQQFLVSGAKTGYYCSWNGKDADPIVIVPVERDEAYIEKLMSALQKFWTRVEMQMPPPTTEKDKSDAVKRVVADQARLAASIKALTLTVGG